MTIDPSNAAPLGVFVMPTPEKLATAVRAMHTAVGAVVGAHMGQLDRVINLSSEGGPVGLGFLDLALELDAPGALLDPLKAAAQVSWVFTATRLAVKVAADVSPVGPVGWHQRVRLETVIEPSALSPGLVSFQARQTDEHMRVKSRKNKIRLRRVPFFLRLRIIEQARPIGSIPQPHNGQWLPFRA
jgi:hypothetical protein